MSAYRVYCFVPTNRGTIRADVIIDHDRSANYTKYTIRYAFWSNADGDDLADDELDEYGDAIIDAASKSAQIVEEG